MAQTKPNYLPRAVSRVQRGRESSLSACSFHAASINPFLKSLNRNLKPIYSPAPRPPLLIRRRRRSMAFSKDQLLARLQELKIEFLSCDHPAVMTVEEQAKYVGHLGGALSKNLFLKDKKHRLYIISALANTKVDLKILSQRLGLGKGGLRMAPEEALPEILHVALGSVTPFSLINESARSVSLLLDKGFKSQRYCLFHPLTNEVTIALTPSDFDKFLLSIGREPAYVDLEDCPVVGKDNPPDLAYLVPAEALNLPGGADKVPPTSAPAQTNATLEQKTKQPTQKPKEPSKEQKQKSGKDKINADAVADSTNVEKFVEKVLEKVSNVFISELSKQSNAEDGNIKDHMLEGVKQRVSSDLLSMTMTLKNSVYAQGFHAGIESTLYPLANKKIVERK
ncbi:Prolyl-tRNA synthetase associated domain-containing protein 1 [Rhynchospora pubera]|uniref:Prolyl-tRNA synthetase associated domain-containing protein 1 n=1 Tax=Rhynchospora pubera TaxID=906938 RepID=A0AAV8HQJ5_9POAL|nr:Prolyl-tRNA synthetase associated domain-containing protein 1 [Rhynchospora pubera]